MDAAADGLVTSDRSKGNVVPGFLRELANSRKYGSGRVGISEFLPGVDSRQFCSGTVASTIAIGARIGLTFENWKPVRIASANLPQGIQVDG